MERANEPLIQRHLAPAQVGLKARARCQPALQIGQVGQRCAHADDLYAPPLGRRAARERRAVAAHEAAATPAAATFAGIVGGRLKRHRCDSARAAGERRARCRGRPACMQQQPRDRPLEVGTTLALPKQVELVDDDRDDLTEPASLGHTLHEHARLFKRAHGHIEAPRHRQLADGRHVRRHCEARPVEQLRELGRLLGDERSQRQDDKRLGALPVRLEPAQQQQLGNERLARARARCVHEVLLALKHAGQCEGGGLPLEKARDASRRVALHENIRKAAVFDRGDTRGHRGGRRRLSAAVHRRDLQRYTRAGYP